MMNHTTISQSAHHLFLSPHQVHHFFKVGEPRSQATAMVRSLAYQLAVKILAYCRVMEEVVKQHGDRSGITLEDA